jgi:hypothetical protein
MARRSRTSHPPLSSSNRKSRRSIHDEDFNDDPNTTPEYYNDRGEDISETDDQPIRQPYLKVMGKHPSNDSFTSILGK